MDGTIGSDLRVKFRLEAKDPSHLWPNLKGRFVASGSIKGTMGDLFTNFDLTASEVTYKTEYYGNYKLGAMTIGFRTDEGNHSNTEGFVKMTHLRIGNYSPIESCDIKWDGNIAHNSASLAFASSPLKGSATWVNTYNRNDETMRIHFKSLQLDINGHGKWQLRDSTDMLMSHFEIKPVSGCLERNGKSACINGSWDQEAGWKMSGDLNKSPIPFLSHSLALLRNEIPLLREKQAGLRSVLYSATESH